MQCQSATQFRIALTPPKVNGQPGLKSKRSLIAEGTPWSGPTAAPDMIACSAAFASRRASSKPLKTKALRLGLRRSIRAMHASTISTGDKRRRRTLSAISAAPM
jgi:hypothetical protein